MSGDHVLLQDRSAKHYLIEAELTWRLQATLSLTAQVLDFPCAMVNILDASMLYNIGVYGLSDVPDTPRSEAICDMVVQADAVLVAEDARGDRRFADLSSVQAGDVGSYVGVPLRGRESLVIGTMCVIDRGPREVTADMIARLTEFGQIVEDQLDLLRRLNEGRSLGAAAARDLMTAIRTGQIRPFYQPIIDLASGSTVGFEALARWAHPSGKLLDPKDFVPLAEDSELVVKLDLAVMAQALSDVARWRERAPDLRVNVNLSTRHFEQADALAMICAVAADSGVPAKAITLELTETVRMVVDSSASGLVNRLREQGFPVLLDDFGTGWSSMEYLLRLPVSGIKIDRELALAMGTRTGDVLTETLTSMASSLDLTTTIEGIATPAQAVLAAELGCDYGQGYLWSPPRSADFLDARGGLWSFTPD